MKTLALNKGKHRFLIRYELGQETVVLGHLVDLVHSKHVPFDWFDAVILSQQLGRDLSKQLRAMLPKDAG